jgi:hypothetical protein
VRRSWKAPVPGICHQPPPAAPSHKRVSGSIGDLQPFLVYVSIIHYVNCSENPVCPRPQVYWSRSGFQCKHWPHTLHPCPGESPVQCPARQCTVQCPVVTEDRDPVSVSVRPGLRRRWRSILEHVSNAVTLWTMQCGVNTQQQQAVRGAGPGRRCSSIVNQS